VTRRYEIVYIFDSTVEEPKVEEQLERFHALLKNGDNPEPIQNVNHWGKRTLAYAIAGNEIGYYVVVQLATDPTLLPEFERVIKLEESVIRYQVVLNEGEVPVPAPLPERNGRDKDDEKRPSAPAGDKDAEKPSAAPAGAKDAEKPSEAPAGDKDAEKPSEAPAGDKDAEKPSEAPATAGQEATDAEN
jgi:small subunit ribosomal protein S6